MFDTRAILIRAVASLAVLSWAGPEWARSQPTAASGPAASRPATIAPSAIRHTWSGVERVVAVGDVHGDCEQLVNVLRLAGLIDHRQNWTGGKAHLVQIGDVLDRGPESKKAMDLLMKLEEQAARAGGAVHALMGNHEAMVLMDDWRYVMQAEEDAFGGREAYRKALSAEGKYGRWIRGHNAAVKIDQTLFVHAGLSPQYADKSLDEINDGVRAEIDRHSRKAAAAAAARAAGGPSPGAPTDDDSLADGPATDSDGPLWYRGLAGDEETVAAQARQIASAQGVEAIVIGHTRTRQGIRLVGGRVIQIDVALSRTYGAGPLECLVIDKDGRWRLTVQGKQRLTVKPLLKKAA